MEFGAFFVGWTPVSTRYGTRVRSKNIFDNGTVVPRGHRCPPYNPTILLLILGYSVNMTTKRMARRAIPGGPYNFIFVQ